MKKLSLILVAAFIVSGVSVASSAQRRARTGRMSPEQLVSDLYRQHKHHSPFFQTRSRGLLDRYFAKQLADLIWQDARSAGNEVGALDGDPLFNAQDMKIRKFVVHPAYYPRADSRERAPASAAVAVTFENFGQPHTITFELSRSAVGWKIADIRYDDGATLERILKGTV
jgi:Protein of unknown function (DUF3828)